MKSNRAHGAHQTHAPAAPIIGVPLRLAPTITSSQRLTLDTAAGEPDSDSALSRAAEARYGPRVLVLGIFTSDDPAVYRAPDGGTRRVFEQLAGLLLRPIDPTIPAAVLDAIADLAAAAGGELLELGSDGQLCEAQR